MEQQEVKPALEEVAEVPKFCPLWQLPCSEVCPKCVMYLDANKQGKLGVIKTKMCGLVLLAQKPPVIVQQGGQLGMLGRN